MKKLKLLSMIAVAGGLFFMTSCAKDGADGLAGANGADGPAGPAGASGSLVTTADQTAYDAANGVMGGKYYNQFYHADLGLGITDPNITGNGEFFRCKSCHGWDLLGNKGSYANRPGTPTRPNVASSDLRAFAAKENIRTVFDAVKHTGGRTKMANGNNKSLNDNHPDYGVILSDANIWDIVKFLKTEAMNTYNLYDITVTGIYPTATITYSNMGKDGLASSGDAYYTSNCAGCHGATGTTISLGGKTLGNFARGKNNELHHKVKYGQLGSSMSNGFGTITEAQMKDLYKALSDTLVYPN